MITRNNIKNTSNMSKKKGINLDVLDNIMGGSEEPQVNSTQAASAEAAPRRGKGRPREDGYEARTFRVKTELVQKLKIIALKEGRLQKDILDFALESAITRYEEKHGVINVEYEQRSLDEIF